MVRPPYYDKYGMKKGLWSEEEDYKLKACITQLGLVVPNWRLLPIAAGLKRCGKSCRLRWLNYLKPGLNTGKFSKLEEDLIIELHNELGNKWSAIAANFSGRTDNDIKNYWNAHIKKRKGGHDTEIRAQSLGKKNLRNDQDQQSSDDNNSCITNGGLSAENMESNADSDNNGYGILLDVDDLPPLIPEEELNGFGLWQNDIVSDYSDAASWFLQEDFLIEGVGEECFSMGLW